MCMISFLFFFAKVVYSCDIAIGRRCLFGTGHHLYWPIGVLETCVYLSVNVVKVPFAAR